MLWLWLVPAFVLVTAGGYVMSAYDVPVWPRIAVWVLFYIATLCFQQAR